MYGVSLCMLKIIDTCGNPRKIFFSGTIVILFDQNLELWYE